MGSTIDSKHSRHSVYHYPLSPPNSATVTAHSSPKLIPNDPPITPSALDFIPPPHRSYSQITKSKWSLRGADDTTSDSDTSLKASRYTKDTQPMSVPRSTRKAVRSLTMPAHRPLAEKPLVVTPPKTARPLYRRSSYVSSASSSSSSNEHVDTLHPSTSVNSGIGRKVAASLQLFKAANDEPKRGESSKPDVTVRTRANSNHKVEGVDEPQFEFVKRSEWPDREAAAIRRDWSSTGLSRVRTRDAATSADVDANRGKERKLNARDNTINDLTQWRNDVQGVTSVSSRGRRLERRSSFEGSSALVDFDLDLEMQSTGSVDTRDTNLKISTITSPQPHPRPSSQVYPLSPSPSRSPFARIPLPSISSEPIPIPSVFRSSSSHHHVPSLDMDEEGTPPTHIVVTPHSPIPTLTDVPPPYAFPFADTPSPRVPGPQLSSNEPSSSYSPWSTDDESGWETASVATSTSTTSVTSSAPLSPPQNDGTAPSYLSLPDDEEGHRYMPLESLLEGHGPSTLDDTEDDRLGLNLDLSQDKLPHIPLRPFRNQVGGHSAIYKFTKRAVCKVSQASSFSSSLLQFLIVSHVS